MSLGALNKQNTYRFYPHLLILSVFIIVLLVSNPGFSLSTSTSKIKSTTSSFESSLVKTSNSPKVYFLDGSTRYLIENVDVYVDYIKLGPLRIVDQEYLESFSFGGALPNIVGSTSNSDVFLIKSGYKMRFSSCDSVADYGLQCSQNIKLSPSQLQMFSDGHVVSKLAKSSYNNAVYYIDGGEKRRIASMADLYALGVGDTITIVSDSMLNTLPEGDKVVTSGSLIKTADSVKVYAVSNWSESPSVLAVNSFYHTVDLGLSNNFTVVSNDQMEKYSIGSTLKTTVKCGSVTYVGTNGVLYEIEPALYDHFGFSSGDFLDIGEVCERLNISQTKMSRFIKYGVSIYRMDDGAKRKFSSYSAFAENGGESATIIPVSFSFANSLVTGSEIHATAPRGELEIAYDLHARVNSERAARGLPALAWNSYLYNNSRNWSIQMANSNSFAHSNLYPLLNTFYVAAENIGLAGAGAKSGAIHKAWMNSTGHRINLLGRNLDVVGIGVYCAPDGRMWVTQQFGRWPNSALPATFGPTPPLNPIVRNDGGGATC